MRLTKHLKKIFFSVVLISTLQIFSADQLPSEYPADHSERIQEVLSKKFASVPQLEVFLKPLKGGFSGCGIYYLEIFDKRYVLRLHNNDENSAKVLIENYMIKQAAEHGVGPQVHYISENGLTVLMDYIDGGTLTYAQAEDTSAIVKIGESIAEIHEISPPDGISENFLELFEFFNEMIDSQSTDFKFMSDVLERARKYYEDLENIKGPKVVIHRDLHSRNIFYTEKGVYFIDWANLTYADPFHDLTYFSGILGYSPLQEALLLQSYLKHTPTEFELKRYYLTKQLSFAYLCILGSFLSSSMIKGGDQVNPAKPILLWSELSTDFAEGENPINAQFFYDIARSAYRSLECSN